MPQAETMAAVDFRQLADVLHSCTRGNERIRVAILDGPVDASHPSLVGARLTTVGGETNSDPSGAACRHGTHVTGIILGQHIGSAPGGLAPGCCGIIMPIFSDNGQESCSQRDLARAMVNARAAGAHIINISAGGISRDARVHPDLALAVRDCSRAGILILAAAGDSGCREPQLPARFTDVLGIAVDPTISAGQGFSARTVGATPPDTGCLLAPGSNIPGPDARGGTAYVSGSSSATAVVSGVAAVLMSVQADAMGRTDANMVRDALTMTAVWDPRLHASILDATAALRYVTDAMEIYTAAGPQRSDSVSRIVERSSQSAIATDSRIAEPGFAVSEEALRNKFRGVTAEKFGSIDIRVPDGSSYNVADLTYPLPSGGRGMRLLPASDTPEFSPGGRAGWTVLDEFLRAAAGLTANDPLYAIISYVHPEEHSTEIGLLPHTSKLTAGHRHVGAYVGGGRTTHALAPDSRWRGRDAGHMALNVDRHPANIQLISLRGAGQATLNRNLSIVDEIVSGLGRVRRETDTLECRVVDAATALQYYRDLLRGEDYLEELGWYVNCSAQKAIIVNVALNLPHDEASFREVFGADGAELWQTLLARYQLVCGIPLPPCTTSFIPLWQLEGIPVDRVRPLTTLEYHSYHAAREEARIDSYPGRKPPPTNTGLAWPLETLPDLLSHFLDTYVGSQAAEGLAAAGETILLRYVLAERLGYAEQEYLNAVVPVVALLLAREAAAVHPGVTALQRLACAPEGLLAWLKAADRLAPGPDQSGDIRTLVERCGQIAATELRALPDQEGDGHRLEHLDRRLEEELSRMRNRMAPPGGRIGFFASPGIFHQLANGIHAANPFVSVVTACTVMDVEDLVPRLDGPSSAQLETNISQPISGGPIMEELTMPAPGGTAPLANPNTVPMTPGQHGEGDECRTCAAKSDPDGLVQGELVYALGEIAYNFKSQGRRDSIAQRMGDGQTPENPADMVAHLDENPFDTAALQWLLTLEGNPIYALEPIGPYASDTLALMRQFLREQLEEGVARLSVPGVILGTTTHKSGTKLPVIAPEARGMYSWTTDALVTALTEDAGKTKAATDLRLGISNFLERVYYELRNLGRQPWERALNFAATNAFEVERVYEDAYRENMELDTIEAVPATLHPNSTSYWDIKLVFFFPDRPIQTVRRVYRFTINVEDVVPATVSPMRSWSIR